MRDVSTLTIAVVGLGYVGLPLAVEFGRQQPTIGLDINARRVDELRAGRDATLEVSESELAAATHLRVTTDPASLAEADVFIVTTPTPIDEHKQPDLLPLLSASATIGGALRPGNIVVYESTVYPGATEERCVPVLEETSGLRFNEDFFVGYSPERINPGDRVHRVTNIVKITSGSTPEIADVVDALYSSIVTAGTHKAPSIRVAEAAKVIENTQRDVNIALMNDWAILFNRLEIDTEDVLVAAGTKWNFLPFRPGLVGGHCIGVDPYYLTHKAQQIGHHPEIILAGRRINDAMGSYVASQLIKRMTKEGMRVRGARVLVLGLAFKENTPDLRNTRVVDILDELAEYGVVTDVYDPWVNPKDALDFYGVPLITDLPAGAYDAVVLAVAHRQFVGWDAEDVQRLLTPAGGIVYDLKYVLPKSAASLRL